jgi:hypothetical protein
MVTKLLALAFLCWAVPDESIYKSVSSRIEFFAGTPVEDIEAVNQKAISFINIQTGEVRISIPNAEFVFQSPLMQEHFNENYMETERYPNSEFKGSIVDVGKFDWKSTAPMKVTVTGTLTIHGIARQRTIEATVSRKGDEMIAQTSFSIALVDHGIERPKILWEKLAENVDVKSVFTYAPLRN